MLKSLTLGWTLLLVVAPVERQTDRPDNRLRLGEPMGAANAAAAPGVPMSRRLTAHQAADESCGQQRKTIELSAAVSSALRAEALATDQQRLACMRQLSALYRELAAHERFANSQLLQRQHRRIFVRMVRTYDNARHGQARMIKQAPENSDLPQVDSTDEVPGVLGQFIGPNNPAANLGAGAAGAGSNDYSDELIEIITRTIQPETWTQLGGSSTIAYYRPSLALVMTAPQEVHAAVARLLTDLRAASGP